MKNVKETVKKSTVWEIKPFRNIRIGDPMYFEEMEAGSTNKHLKDITANFKTTCCKAGICRVSEKHIVLEDGFEFDTIVMNVNLGKDKDQAIIYDAGRWYGENTVKKNYELGCDTAEFEIEIDGRYDLISTGADGYYGHLSQMKQYYGLMLTLEFDADWHDFDDVVKLAEYWFEKKVAKRKSVA